MKHRGTVKLETERLVLRRFTPEDMDAMFYNWANGDLEIARFLDWQNGMFNIINQWIFNYAFPYGYCWAIVPKDLDEPIGYINAHDVDEFSESIEIGYAIGKNFWNKGIATEAANKIVKFLLEEVGVQEITAKHRFSNPHSGNVMSKVGMRYLGIRRNALGVSNVGMDVDCYAILAKDYFCAKKVEISVVPYESKYRDDMLFCYLSAKDAINRYAPAPDRCGKPTLREDLLDIEQNYVKRGDVFYLAIDADDRVVGMLGTKKVSSTEMWLKRFFVKPELKGKGIGSKLLAVIESYAIDKDITTIYTRFADWYHKTAIFYQAKGFRKVESEGNLYYMVKRIVR